MTITGCQGLPEELVDRKGGTLEAVDSDCCDGIVNDLVRDFGGKGRLQRGQCRSENWDGHGRTRNREHASRVDSG